MMKNLPKVDSSIGRLFKLPYEALKWELVKIALELKIFNFLAEPSSSEEVSAKFSLHPANTEFFLNALAALGLLVKENGKFSNSSLAKSFLCEGRDTSIGESLLFMGSWVEPVLNGGIRERLHNGPPEKQDIGSEDIWEKGARASLNFSRCGRAQRIAELVAALPEFPLFSKMLDLGAGPGIIGIAVAAAHPGLECVLWDQAAVCKVADEVITEYGMEDRVKTVKGDYMKDSLGTDFDFIMANFTLNFYRDHLDGIMRKIFNALKPNGIFMVTSDGLSEDKTAPAASVISWLPTMLQGNDMSFETGIIARAMRDAGFVSTEQRTLTNIDLEAHGPVEVIIARKSG